MAESTLAASVTPSTEDRSARLIKSLKINTLIFIVLVVAALVGVAMTNSAKTQAYMYWWILIGIEAVIITIWAIWLSRQQILKKPVQTVLYEQLVLWLAALGAVSLIYRLMGVGLVDINTAGLLMLLMLAFATFVAGALVSWQLYIVSLIFVSTLLFASYIEKYLWALILITLLIAVIAVAISYWYSRRHHSTTT